MAATTHAAVAGQVLSAVADMEGMCARHMDTHADKGEEVSLGVRVTQALSPSPVSHALRCRQTTIMAVSYDGGVVLGADSRTSTGAPHAWWWCTLPACLPALAPKAAADVYTSVASAYMLTSDSAVPCMTAVLCGTGTWVANRVADKISSLADNVYICRSGSVSRPSFIVASPAGRAR